MRIQTAGRHRRLLLPVLVYIEANLTRDLSLDELAGVAGFSPFHFHRLFTQVVGEPVKEYIRRLRLERAVRRLKTGQESVIAIALESGFKTHESFTRSFVRRFGMAPSEFRAWLASLRACVGDLEASYALAGLSEEDPAWLARNPGPVETIELRRLDPLDLAFVRYTGAYEALPEIGVLWAPLFAWARAHGLCEDDLRLVGICHDDPFVTLAERIRFDACIVVPEPGAPEGRVGFQCLRPGLCAVRRHSGAFDQIAKTYAYLGVEWQPPDGYRLGAAASFEIYACRAASGVQHRLYTEACVPLEPLQN